MSLKAALSLTASFLVAGCSIIPDVPSDDNLPVREILQHTACELQRAFQILSLPQYKSFNAKKWLIAVKLSPKTDAEVSGGLGLTGKSTSVSGAHYFNNWALGSVGSPGAAVDAKGTRNVSIVFKMSSKELLNAKDRLICPVDSPRYHILAQHLGIGEWLVRLVESKDYAVGSLATLDTPTYSSEIVVKFTGNGNFTYNFPLGTHFGAVSGLYDFDETLEITLSPDKGGGPPLVVQTLPVGGNFQDGPDTVPAPSRVTAEKKLDDTVNQQGLINAIRNLPH